MKVYEGLREDGIASGPPNRPLFFRGGDEESYELFQVHVPSSNLLMSKFRVCYFCVE